jgi:hypothetical protein
MQGGDQILLAHWLEEKKMKFKQSLLSMAVAASTGFVVPAQADIVTGTWVGSETMLNSTGSFTANNDIGACLNSTLLPGYVGGCNRSATSGTLTFDTATGTGSVNVDPYSWGGGGNFVMTPISLQTIGNGAGGPGTLMLGNMGMDWNGTNGIPISMVYDAAGFLGALSAGLAISQTVSVGAAPASDNGDGAFPNGAILATTTWNTTSIAGATFGSNPSGTLPLIADTIGGDPMIAGPFLGQSFNFDVRSLHVTGCTDTGTGTNACASAVPIPATVWLFGSGLLGLIGIARRRR